VPAPSSLRELRTAVGETLRAWWAETAPGALAPGRGVAVAAARAA
jgi:hypothetical protein